jgi:hypothetical protein
MTVNNESLPCNNTGSYRFDRVLLRRHGSLRWAPIPMQAVLSRDPSIAFDLLSRTSFTVTSAP